VTSPSSGDAPHAPSMSREARRARRAFGTGTERRNLVEQLKHDKPGLALLDELPLLARTSYERLDEGDVLRLQWLGLYHDKPKVGRFMLRVRLPGGAIAPHQLAELGRISVAHGRSSGELTTRQDIQLHEIELAALPEIFRRLDAVGLSTVGACGDVVRNITGCPLAGRLPGEVFDVGPDVTALARRFSARVHGNLPRKHKWTVTACPAQCSAPEIHDVGLVAMRQGPDEGYALRLGGGLSTAPRIARELGAFVPRTQVGDVLAAVLERWSTDPRYRTSRGRSRFKFLVEDLGPEALRAHIEDRLGTRLAAASCPAPVGRASHLGLTPLARPGTYALGVPVRVGLVGGEQMIGLAALALRLDVGVRLTREQNVVLVDVAETAIEAARRGLVDLGLDPAAHALAGTGIACTGNPYCNFAVGSTKPRLAALLDALAARYGDALGELRVYLDGCPHACGQHWVGDLGIQGTTTKRDGVRIEAYDLLLRGQLGASARIADCVARKVPTEALDSTVFTLVDHYLAHRATGETLPDFFARLDDAQIAQVLA